MKILDQEKILLIETGELQKANAYFEWRVLLDNITKAVRVAEVFAQEGKLSQSKILHESLINDFEYLSILWEKYIDIEKQRREILGLPLGGLAYKLK